MTTTTSKSHSEREVKRAAVIISMPDGMSREWVGKIGLVTHFNYQNKENMCRIEMRCGTVVLLNAGRLMDVDIYQPEAQDALLIELMSRSK